MKKQTGIWIDTKQAVIVFLGNKSEHIKIVNSGIEGRERFPGEKRLFSRFRIQFGNFESKKEKRKIQDVENYLKKVVNEIKNTDEVVLFGPAEMKTELEKFILNKSLNTPIIKRVETTDKMTQNQIAAWVKNFYQTNK